MNVANITDRTMIHGLIGVSRFSIWRLLHSYFRDHRHAGPETMLGIFAGLENELHGNALHDLHIIAGRVLGRQKTELRAGRRGDALDVDVVYPSAVSIDGHRAGLSGMHLRELRLLEIAGNPD